MVLAFYNTLWRRPLLSFHYAPNQDTESLGISGSNLCSQDSATLEGQNLNPVLALTILDPRSRTGVGVGRTLLGSRTPRPHPMPSWLDSQGF